MGEKDIITIRNNHSHEVGEVPDLDFDQYNYVSYYENAYGEQNLLVFDENESEVVVYVADAGWSNPIKLPAEDVISGNIEKMSEGQVLIEPEVADWLEACRRALRRRYKLKQ